MKQHVDLSHGPEHRRSHGLSARHIGAAAVVSVLASLAVGAGLRTEAWRLRGQLEDLHAQESLAARRVVELAESHPPAVVDPGLEAELRRRSAERDAKSRLVQLLEGEGLGDTRGFSPHLAGLGRQRVNGLWLREIHIDRRGQAVALAGSAVDPERVPRLIQALTREEAFAGTDFRALRIERAAEDPRRVDFVLATDEEGAP